MNGKEETIQRGEGRTFLGNWVLYRGDFITKIHVRVAEPSFRGQHYNSKLRRLESQRLRVCSIETSISMRERGLETYRASCNKC